MELNGINLFLQLLTESSYCVCPGFLLHVLTVPRCFAVPNCSADSTRVLLEAWAFAPWGTAGCPFLPAGLREPGSDPHLGLRGWRCNFLPQLGSEWAAEQRLLLPCVTITVLCGHLFLSHLCWWICKYMTKTLYCENVVEMGGEAVRILPKKRQGDWQVWKQKSHFGERLNWWDQASVLRGMLHSHWGK